MAAPGRGLGLLAQQGDLPGVVGVVLQGALQEPADGGVGTGPGLVEAALLQFEDRGPEPAVGVLQGGAGPLPGSLGAQVRGAPVRTGLAGEAGSARELPPGVLQPVGQVPHEIGDGMGGGLWAPPGLLGAEVRQQLHHGGAVPGAAAEAALQLIRQTGGGEVLGLGHE